MQLSDSDLTKKLKQQNPPNIKPISAASLTDKEPERGLLPVLKNGKFLILWSGQVFSQLADKVYLVLMIAIIANQFQAADQTISGWVSAIMIAFTIPAVLFGAGAGVYVDRWPKKQVLVTTNIVRGALVLILPIVLWLSNNFNLGNLPLGFCLMLFLTFLVSTLTQFFAPAEQAVIPLIVEKRHLLSANSLYTTTMMASVIIGFAVGDPLLEFADSLVAKIGFGESLGKELVVGGSYAIAGLLLILLKTGEQKSLSDKEQPHILADLQDGLRYLKNHHPVRNAIIQQIVLFSIFAALAVLAVRLAEIIPGMEAEEFGLLLAAAGVGLGIGAGIVGQLGHWLSHFQLSLLGSIGMAVSLVGLSIFNQEFWAVMGLIGILGMFGAVVGVPMQTTVQAETPEEMRGKVFGLQNNAVNIALSLPLALAGVMETFLGLPKVLLGLAGVVIVAGIFFSLGNRE
ncbi:MAG: MFS transporter [Okeania sp. SIO3I5]|uniref:MFS transporter n=1 Tax=Okeania sp. SIO3I5 TaxID=2607805 RepID=UPI0013B8E56E|nr:MFS transporter [Okeania sp. SIO3I5]NEQ39715.1 MFS transporter [Okeania sp. SIO3I5]